MRKQFQKLFFALLIALPCMAQKPEEALNRRGSHSPIEKIYLHFDKDSYMAGETVWFKSYLYSEYLPDTISTTLYVELSNDASLILDRKILPVFSGNTNGQFELPDSLQTGSYFIRAYSPTMLNPDKEFVYTQRLLIYGKSPKTGQTGKQKRIRLEFFPESGNFISEFINTIAFKASDENGLPVNVSGVIKNDKNEMLVEFNSYHDGMGTFSVNVKPNEKYYAVLNGDPSAHQYDLPAATNHGIVFRIAAGSKKKYYEIEQSTDDPAFTASYMIGQMQHHVVFKQEFSPGKKEITGIIKTSDLNSGILQITVFNKDDLPLAERIIFIDNKEYVQPVQLTEDTVQFSEKARNHFTISLKDTVQASLSIAVTDADYSLSPISKENIFSRLLLSSDLKGYVHDPAWYFSGNSDSLRIALDLVMMTNGWRRFTWNKILNNDIPPHSFKDPGYITLTGKALIRDSKKSFASKSLLIFIATADSSRILEFTNTGEDGDFKIDSLIFFDKARILFSDIRGWKSAFINVNLSGDSLTRSFSLSDIEKQISPAGDPWSDSSRLKLAFDYDSILKAKGITLKGITLKVRRKTAMQEVEERYSNGLFSTYAEKTIDLVNTNERVYGRNIFEYLQGTVPGLSISRTGNGYSVIYRGTASFSTAGFLPMQLFLDEMPMDASVIATIPVNDIAMVKVFNHFVGAEGNGAGGVLAVYTKKGSDLYNSMPSTGDQVLYSGYSVIKEFYSPDYSVDSTAKTKTDQRITLQWLPNIVVDGINTEIPVIFYNNDRTRRFKIVVQGMTGSGKMISIEKIISVETSKKPF